MLEIIDVVTGKVLKEFKLRTDADEYMRNGTFENNIKLVEVKGVRTVE